MARENGSTRCKVAEKVNGVIGKFYLVNGNTFHVARSPYFEEMMSMVAKRRPSCVPSSKHRLRTTILDNDYTKIGALIETMRASS